MAKYKIDHTHEAEIRILSEVTRAQYVHENELAQKYRNNKYSVMMSSNAHSLLQDFLQKKKGGKHRPILRLVNQYLNFSCECVIIQAFFS
jgi:transcription initiation factor TFIID subunit 5